MLQFAEYEFEKYGYMPPPPPSLNGGLYTGESFKGPWGNVPVIPDATYMINKNLVRGNGYVAPGSTFQYPPSRQGNSFVDWNGLKRYQGTALNSGPFNIYCPPCCTSQERHCYCEDICPKTETKLCNRDTCVHRTSPNGFSKYYYIK